jgi:hypothetical protein
LTSFIVPLAHRHMGDDVVHQVRRRLRHASGAARRPEAAPLAAEGDELVVAAVAAAQPQKAVGRDAALEKGIEVVPDVSGQLGNGARFCTRDEAGPTAVSTSTSTGTYGMPSHDVKASGAA